MKNELELLCNEERGSYKKQSLKILSIKPRLSEQNYKISVIRGGQG